MLHRPIFPSRATWTQACALMDRHIALRTISKSPLRFCWLRCENCPQERCGTHSVCWWWTKRWARPCKSWTPQQCMRRSRLPREGFHHWKCIGRWATYHRLRLTFRFECRCIIKWYSFGHILNSEKGWDIVLISKCAFRNNYFWHGKYFLESENKLSFLNLFLFWQKKWFILWITYVYDSLSKTHSDEFYFLR